jgi:hypothetical protein
MSSVAIEAIFDRLLSGDSDEDSGEVPYNESDRGPNLGSRGIYGLIDKQIRNLVTGEPAGKVVSLAIRLYT